MTYTYTKYNQADCIHCFYMGKEFREELYFDSLQSYFSFLIMKFLSSKHKVVRCSCCGKFFIPKTKRETLYCDRIAKNGRTCKQVGPALSEYFQWLDRAERTRSEFLKGEISEEEALGVICV